MSNNTSIEWTDHTWNFISAYAGRRRGWFCTKRTKACANCYAEAINLRLGNGLTYPAQWPLANVALLVSVGEQKDADEFIPYLLRTPAVVRGLSLEPLLGPVKLESLRINNLMPGAPGFDWLIIGGESGKKARPCNVEWIRSLIKQGRAADLAVFVKQLGAKPTMSGIAYAAAIPVGIECKHGYDVCPKCDSEDKPLYPKLKHKKGGNWSEWPADLRVREFPPGCEPRP